MNDFHLTRRMTRTAHNVESMESLSAHAATAARPSYLGRSNAPGRLSLFHKNTVAFAPDPDTLPSHIDAIANLPAPYRIRKGTSDFDPSIPLHLQHNRKTRSSSTILDGNADEDKPRPSQLKFSKIQLPPPYKKHWAEIEGRRAKRDFIYGRDEDYEFSERDSRVKSTCCGVLFFHTIELLDLIVNTQSFIDNIPVSFYCNISCGQIKRTTKIVHSRFSHQVKIDSGVHLSIEISEWKYAPGNRIRVELWSFQDPEAHFIVGTVEMHVYNFIRLQHIIGTTHLWSDGIKVGKLAYETAFSYGAFGYGHSNQLMNFSQPLMETISHSMFPRIKLDEMVDICDKTFQARKPDNLRLFTYHSFILEMDARNPYASTSTVFNNSSKKKSSSSRKSNIKLEPMPMHIEQVEFNDGFPVHCKLHMNIAQKRLQADFNDMYGEFICLGHKRERLEYITNMVQGRMRDMYQNEAGTLFGQLHSKDVEKIHRTENIPGEIIFPKKVPCPYSEQVVLQSGDEKFQNKFPTVRREQGYLATMLGFKKKPAPKQFLNNMDYPAYKESKIPQIQNVTVQNCSALFFDWLKRTFLRMKAFTLKTWSFIFPEFTHELEVPGISLTVATPEESTTNIHAYFAREGKDMSASRTVDRLVQQTTALIGMTKKPNKRVKLKKKRLDDEEDTSSSDNEDEEKLRKDLL